MTTSPTFDIIVPAWNDPAKTRACIVSILDSAPDRRLILINNGCDHATEQVLVEFCEHLGEQALYLAMGRAIGFVPAVNLALARSDADWALLVRPGATLTPDCFQQISEAALRPETGIITPHCPVEYQLPTTFKKEIGCIESCAISFSALALSRIMRKSIGLFDEGLDGASWCLRDYRHRADAHGFQTCLLPNATVHADPVTVFGSQERRRELQETAAATFHKRWGTQQQAALYLTKDTDDAALADTLARLLAAARHGHRFDLFLHGRQHAIALKSGADRLHSGITLHKLPLLGPMKSLARQLERLKQTHSHLTVLHDFSEFPLSGHDSTTSLTQLATS